MCVCVCVSVCGIQSGGIVVVCVVWRVFGTTGNDSQLRDFYIFNAFLLKKSLHRY